MREDLLSQLLMMQTASLQVGANQPLLLKQEEECWLVAEGEVDIFVVHCYQGVADGARQHLLRVGPGQLLFPIDIEKQGLSYALLVVGIQGTRLVQIPRSSLYTLSTRKETAPDILAVLEQWIESVSRAACQLGQKYPPASFVELSPEEEHFFFADDFLYPPDSVKWVMHQGGSWRWLGEPSLPFEPPPGLLPVNPFLWYQAVDDNQVLIADPLTLDDPTHLWNTLYRFQWIAMAYVCEQIEQIRERERAHMQMTVALRERQLQDALFSLSSAFLGEKQVSIHRVDQLDPLFAACEQICEYLNIEIHKPPASESADLSVDPLQRIATASRFRLRRVALKENWWRYANEPLLCYIKDDGRPVALLPDASQRYRLIDPSTGASFSIDHSNEESLESFAYVLTRPFPEKALQVRDLLRFGLQDCRRDLRLIFALGLLGGLLGLLIPIATKLFFETIIPGREHEQLSLIVMALFATVTTITVFHWIRSLSILRIEGKIDATVQAAVWDRLLRLPTPFFRKFSTGDLATRAMGIYAVRQAISGATVSALLDTSFALLSFLLLFYYSWQLALIACLVILTIVFFTGGVSLRMLRYQRELQEVEGKLSGLVFQLLVGIGKLRVAGAEAPAFGLWAEQFAAKKTLAYRSRWLGNLLVVFNHVIPIATSMAFFGVIATMEKGIEPSTFIAFAAAFGLVLSAAISMNTAFLALIQVTPTYERIKPIIQTLPEVYKARTDPGILRGGIEMGRVNFRYHPDGPLVLKDISIQIQPGEFVAFVGPSGSGKSTIMRLLLGFETPESGSIYYDNQDLQHLDIQLVRQQIGVVLQHSKLIPGDIFSNIVGSSGLTLDDAWEAARMAGLEEDIQQMPMGMHTIISEGGGTFSGGQRQRLLIARAIARRPRILFFDEATSALDNQTQAIVSQSLENLNATRIVIAHRLSTIRNADQIIVLEHGRIKEHGTYDELLTQGGLFTELARRQLL